MPELLQWNPSYSVGNRALDAQHQWMLELCNRAQVCELDETQESISTFHLILNELVDYARNHFLSEESFLRSIMSPLLGQQIAEHQEYNEKLTEFLFDATTGIIDKRALSIYLGRWWAKHILVSDMQYKKEIESSENLSLRQ